jgi:hypothetical protein
MVTEMSPMGSDYEAEWVQGSGSDAKNTFFKIDKTDGTAAGFKGQVSDGLPLFCALNFDRFLGSHNPTCITVRK